MPAPRKYPSELRERSIRLVAEAVAEDGSLSMNAAVKRIARGWEWCQTRCAVG
jgi:transposase